MGGGCWVRAPRDLASEQSKAGPPDERGSIHGQSAAFLIYYINSSTTRGGASTKANSPAIQKGSVNEGVIRKDNE